jgi:ribosome-associated protein
VSRQIAIRGETIRLGQLLKLAGIVDSGGEARELLASGPVMVNGAPETRRGRQLHPGDTVHLDDHELLVTVAEDDRESAPGG